MSGTSGTQAENLGGGVVLLALGVVVLFAASQNPWLTSSGAIGPAAVPGVCGALLAILGAFQIAFALRARRRPTASEVAVPAGAGTASGAESPDLDDALSAGDGAARMEAREESAAQVLAAGDDHVEPGEGSFRQAVLAWAGVLVAAIAFNRLGALPTVGLLAIYLLAVIGRKSWRTTLLYTALLVGAIYVIFVVLLNIPLPTNSWMG